MIQIDKFIVYRSHDYKLKNFVLLTDNEKHLVWQWRNEEKIRQWMYNTEFIPWENHLRFVESLENQTDRYYWLIYNGEEPIGVLDLTRFDSKKDKAEIGYYSNPHNHGLGFEMLKECFNFCFNVIEISHLFLSVRLDNRRAVLLNQFLGMNYSSVINMDINGVTVPYLVCRNFTKADFKGKYNLSKNDYNQYILKNL